MSSSKNGNGYDVYPELILPQGITYNSTRQDVLKAYGKPTLVMEVPVLNEIEYVYYSDDYVSMMELTFSSVNDQLKRIEIKDEIWFKGNAKYEENVKNRISLLREDALKSIQE